LWFELYGSSLLCPDLAIAAAAAALFLWFELYGSSLLSPDLAIAVAALFLEP
jgi:hypothetical protein